MVYPVHALVHYQLCSVTGDFVGQSQLRQPQLWLCGWCCGELWAQWISHTWLVQWCLPGMSLPTFSSGSMRWK